MTTFSQHTGSDAAALANQRNVRFRRRTQKAELLACRKKLSASQRAAASTTIIKHLERESLVPDLARLGFYWPLNGEIDIRQFIRSHLKRFAVTALPVIIGKDQPMEFWQWEPRTTLCSRGLWGIPAPAIRNLISPTVVLVPLFGFDEQGFQLGHGDVYYNRTLPSIEPKPLSIGIGYMASQVDTIYPQPDDVAMDVIVTEAGLLRRR